MTRLDFSIVDVFAEARYAGNQLAVFRNVGDLPAEAMQRLAQETNYSETTFIRADAPAADGGYDVRIFTPMEEVPFAGHPTLGTAHVIRELLLGGKSETITLNLPVGRIPVTFGPDGYAWMQQVAPTFGPRHTISELAPVLSLAPEDIDPRFPIEEVSTGLPFFIVPLNSLDALRRAGIHRDRYFEMIRDTWAKGILVFCPEAHEAGNDLSVRVFVDCYGIPEDPATGSGNGCLAGYLVQHHYTGSDEIDLRSEQGYEIGRPSLLLLRAARRGDEIAVAVGGRSQIVARGEFL